MMKYLQLISLSFLVIALCGAWDNNNQQCIVTEGKDSTGLYSINLKIYNKNFSGLLLFKKHTDSTIRTIIASEMGPKILDLELLPETYSVNFVIKKLNKKIILNSLYNDFGAISGIFTLNKIKGSSTNSNNETHYKLLSGKEISIKSDSVQNCTITQFFNKKEKELVIYYFCNSSHQMCDSIFLKHYNFKMNIILKRINY
jgi:hypothetical protein